MASRLCRASSAGAARWLLEDVGKASPYSPKDTLRPGLRALEAPWADWLLRSDAMDKARSLKQKVFNDNRLLAQCAVSDQLDSTRLAAIETLQMISEATRNSATSTSPTPLVAASELVGEDLVLLRQQGDDAAIICALCVCFSIGQLDEKLGQPLSVVHGPVPGGASLKKPLERIFAKIRPERGFSRHNFEFRWSGDLLHPSLSTSKEKKGQLDAGVDLGPERIYLRTEYQTLRRLPESNHILFTIASHSDSLLDIVAEYPMVAAEILSRVNSFSDAMCAYKGITPDIREQLVRFLKHYAQR